MENFTPLSGLAGGVLIGLSATAFILLNGKIAGISGIVGGLLSPNPSDIGWRAAFVIGLIVGPFLVDVGMGGFPTIEMPGSMPVLIVSGLLVGIGTRLGNGCTSGHGICGLARGSARSLAATAAFFVTALIVVYVTRHLVGA